MATSRARVIYQSEALYVGQPAATGHHFSVGRKGSAIDERTGIFKEPSTINDEGIFNYANMTNDSPVDVGINLSLIHI